MKYKILHYKGIGNYFVYKRYLFFFWELKNRFISHKEALEYVGLQCCKIEMK